MNDAYTNDRAGLLRRLGGAKRVLVTTHVRPDGDAVGSAAAMMLGLRGRGVAAELLLLSSLPERHAFLLRDNGIAWHDAEKGWPAALEMSRFEALLVVDTGTWSQLPELKEHVAGWGGVKLVVDHHLTQEGWADLRVVDTAAAAAGEIVRRLLAEWGVVLNKAMAEALFVAVASDTGWFQYSNTTPPTQRLAADLLEAGADIDALYQRLYQSERAERIAIHARGMQSMKLLAGGRLAIMRLGIRDFEETGAGPADTENLINVPMSIASVQVSVLAVQPAEGGEIRMSLRSKGQMDVAKFAERFGGGGHARAAGIKIAGMLDDVVGRVGDELQRELLEAGCNAG